MKVVGGGPRSRSLFRRAQRSLVGGVDSPVRSFRAVGGAPVFFASGAGAYLTDVDGRRYLDLVGSWGALILGHAPPTVVRAVVRTARRGFSFGAPSPLEHELAERIRRCVPSMDLLRFVSSGTEAVMAAVRTARGFTGRPMVLKFEGSYHGHSDGLLARAGSGLTTHGLPDSAGVPSSVVRDTLVVPYNDPDAVGEVCERFGERLAAILVEPVAANMGVVPPAPGFLRALQHHARRAGALLIADEVITGFRLRKGVVHTELGAQADLVTLGKVIGGGLNVAAYGGRQEVMETVAPIGPVYQAGTLAGNPVGMAAGIATIDRLVPLVYRRLERSGAALQNLLEEEAERSRANPLRVNRVGSMLGVFFTDEEVRDFSTARQSSSERYARFFHTALAGGVYLPPSAWESTFVSAAMTRTDLARSRRSFARAFVASRLGRSR